MLLFPFVIAALASAAPQADKNAIDAARARFIAEVEKPQSGGWRYKVTEHGGCKTTIQRLTHASAEEAGGLVIPWGIDWRNVSGVREERDDEGKTVVAVLEGYEPWFGRIDSSHRRAFIAAAKQLARACGGMK